MGEGAVLDRGLPGMRPRLLLLGKDARAPLLTSLAYLIGAEAAFLVGTLSDTIFAPFWPPNVVLFCALLLAPAHRWWIYLVAAAPAHILAELQVAMPAAEIAVAFATNCLVAVLNAVLVRRVLKAPPWLGTLKRASLYVVLTAFVGPAISAFGGAFVPILGGGAIDSLVRAGPERCDVASPDQRAIDQPADDQTRHTGTERDQGKQRSRKAVAGRQRDRDHDQEEHC